MHKEITDYYAGEVVCTECGEVLEERFESGEALYWWRMGYKPEGFD